MKSAYLLHVIHKHQFCVKGMPVAHGVLISMNLKCQRGIPDVSITFHGILLLLKMSCKSVKIV